MTNEFTPEVRKSIETEFQRLGLHRPMRVRRYDEGTELVYDVTGVSGGETARVRLLVDRFVGGGFAGQVYRVKVLGIEPDGASIGGLTAGGTYAMKILVPPSTFSRIFRNFIYWIAFTGPFQLQVNPAAARSGALWQKFIRRAAGKRLGDDRCVADIHGTFVDPRMGSCGDLVEWIDGRTWRLEVDDHMDVLGRWAREKPVDRERLGSPEYRAKYTFMRRFVALLHEMGAHEFARQYEWSTWKSQPNCLKRRDTEAAPDQGLVAVDFRAGLALLPFLPMSPGDFKLIGQGLARGSLVQFDRGDVAALRRFVETREDDFPDMAREMEELERAEKTYRDSLPDLTHHHVRLLHDRSLWSTILSGAVTGWKTLGLIEDKVERRLRNRSSLVVMFALLGWIPFLGPFFRRLWGRAFWREHYGAMLKRRGYFGRSVRGGLLERVLDWHRKERITDETALGMARRPLRAAAHLPLSLLPGGIHRALTDWPYAKDRLGYYLARPVRLYFNAKLRDEWLRDMVEEGRRNHLLRDEDAATILSQTDEPFIQKYLKSLAVHVCTLPITQIVSVTIAVVYVATHPEMSRAEAWAVGLGIIALFQVLPLSPGSLARGLYVVYLVLRERNFKDYNIAVFLGFFKYVGYLAFPIQMAYRFPTLARFMAAHWATGAVHVVPVFGERGALLEHFTFRVFYNWPLTIRRRMRRRAMAREVLAPRLWHAPLLAAVCAALFGLADALHSRSAGALPDLGDLWWLVIAGPFLCGVLVTTWAGGAALWKRVTAGASTGLLAALLSVAASAAVASNASLPPGDLAAQALWRVFLFTLISTAGVLLTEALMPEPEKG